MCHICIYFSSGFGSSFTNGNSRSSALAVRQLSVLSGTVVTSLSMCRVMSDHKCKLLYEAQSTCKYHMLMLEGSGGMPPQGKF